MFVEKLVKVNRNVFLIELDFMVLIFVLLKLKFFLESVINLFYKVFSCYEKVNIILIFVENGSFDVVNEFRIVLKDCGYCDILELLDLFVNYSKVGKDIIKNMCFFFNFMYKLK